MLFDTLKSSQKEALTIILNSYHQKRLSHAYIFEGEAGTKKFDTALFFAALQLCESEEKPCGHCHACKRVIKQTHPNVYTIIPSKNSIKKEGVKFFYIK